MTTNQASSPTLLLIPTRAEHSFGDLGGCDSVESCRELAGGKAQWTRVENPAIVAVCSLSRDKKGLIEQMTLGSPFLKLFTSSGVEQEDTKFAQHISFTLCSPTRILLCPATDSAPQGLQGLHQAPHYFLKNYFLNSLKLCHYCSPLSFLFPCASLALPGRVLLWSSLPHLPLSVRVLQH